TGRAYSPPCEGGVVAHKLCFEMRFETLAVSDHPVCGASVAARLFIDAAATPPLQGGECAPLNSSTIHSHLHRPPLQSILLFSENAFAVMIVFADRLEDLFAGRKSPGHVKRPGLFESTRILDRHIHIQVRQIGTAIA